MCACKHTPPPNSGTVKTGNIIIHSISGEQNRAFITPQNSLPGPDAHQAAVTTNCPRVRSKSAYMLSPIHTRQVAGWASGRSSPAEAEFKLGKS